MDIAEWLDGLGLGRYAPAFVENEVDWEILPKPTADDLREMGVVAVGHRRRLLEAIAGFATPVPASAAARLRRATPSGGN